MKPYTEGLGTQPARRPAGTWDVTVRSKAPLRLGLAGGGTDVSPYSETYGGMVLNATIDKFAYCTIETSSDMDTITFDASDRDELFKAPLTSHLPLTGDLLLHKAAYDRIIGDFNEGVAIPMKMTTYSDAPAGSGLGSSSALVVAIVKAYVELLNLPMGDYEIARLAWDIERRDVGLSGGKQDQYAATFGGFNFIEFLEDGSVIVNPLRIKKWALNELQNSMLLYFTGTSRDSAKIIDDQIASTSGDHPDAVEGMHELKRGAVKMKQCLLQGDFDGFAGCVREGWNAKKRTSPSISNPEIDELHDFIMTHGGRAAKLSGAGGGGFMMIVCEPTERYRLSSALASRGGTVSTVAFTEYGTQAWTLY